MKTLVIPDIHTRWQKAKSIVDRYDGKVDETVLLGDYFDNFEDSPKLNKRTAQWLKEEIIHHKKRIALLGNHEFNYILNRHVDKCAGYSSSKNWKINSVLTTKDWYQFKPYHFTQGFLLTHAGLTATVGEKPFIGFDKEKFQEEVNKQLAEFLILRHNTGGYFRVGMCRGGRYATGGITWCHFPNEFMPPVGINQIFGHTPGSEPRQYLDTKNWCIDTHLNHVAIIDDGEVEIIKI